MSGKTIYVRVDISSNLKARAHWEVSDFYPEVSETMIRDVFYEGKWIDPQEYMNIIDPPIPAPTNALLELKYERGYASRPIRYRVMCIKIQDIKDKKIPIKYNIQGGPLGGQCLAHVEIPISILDSVEIKKDEIIVNNKKIEEYKKYKEYALSEAEKWRKIADDTDKILRH